MHCSIIPEFVFQEIIQKVAPEERGLFVRSLETTRNFIANMKSMQLDGTAPASFGAKTGRNCVTHDCENTFNVPGKLILSEKDTKHKVADAEKAHAGAKFTYDFFKEVFGRNSLDNKDISLRSHVKYGKDYANAFYDGTNNMVYGEGDGQIIGSFVITDVIGHEFSHGVTQNTANLEYYSQPGALNEHYSDCFGSMIKQFSLGQTAKEADWLIGEGLFLNGLGKALRDMVNPGEAYDSEIIGKDPQTNHMDNYNHGNADNQMVHINSGIPNRIFANVAIQLEENSWERAGKIWWNTLTNRLNRKSNFQDAANAWTAEAGELFGKASREQKLVIDSCKMVGLRPIV